MLKTRIVNGIVAACILMSALFLAPAWLYLIILIAVCTLAMLEFYIMLDSAKVSTFKAMGVAGAVIYNLAVFIEYRHQLNCGLELLALFLIVGSLFVRQLAERGSARLFDNIASTLLGIMYIGFLLSFLTRILFYNGSYSGQWLLFYLLALIKISDSGAYFAGTYLGRHKMAPRVSPKKTWEGFVGGIGAGLIASIAIYFALGGDFKVIQMRLFDAVALGILLPCVGTLGDLSESLLKRAAGTKDSSTVLKGLGGMLDLADSVMPSVAVLYFWSKFFIS